MDDMWVRRFHPAPDSPARLIALPHAGGSASYYFPVSAALSRSVEVLAVQYPGRQDRRLEPVITTINDLADRCFAALEPWLDRPVAFFGHSMGAILGYELGLRLQRRTGRAPLRLFASGRRAPSCVRDETVHLRDDAGVLAEVRRLGGTDAQVFDDPELIPLLLPVIRGDYTAIETYRAAPGGVLDCPITVVTGDRDPLTTIEEARAWQRHTSRDCELTVLSGGHFFLSRHASTVIRMVGARLAQDAPAGAVAAANEPAG